ncbi:hypothetical protein F9C28_03055 [Shimwellia pseudoproteus]|uniref:YncE family protein n=1 Tax=Shimwellia pseudoproteus TaxID=570012 RepID=UPI0018EDC79E|nr:hypothetical protein [Shimwellia pseudoproteus]MBJ3813933.1 hypothetical protein [Shimwellia pseudoproteus]
MKALLGLPRASLTVAVMATFTLGVCHAQQASVAAPAITSMATVPDKRVIQRPLGEGLYELVYSPAANAIYVASAQGFKNTQGGMLYRLNPATLETTGETHTDLKNFGMVRSDDGTLFYTTNSLDGSISKVDARTGKIIQRLALSGGKDKDGNPAGAREMLLHGTQLYIGRVADPGFIDVVDTRTFTLKTTIKNAGKWVTGIIYSPLTNKIYAANGGGEILVINPGTHKIEQRWKPQDGKNYLFLNMAEDPATGRLFVTDNAQGKATLVFDEHSGKVINRIPGDALGIKFSAPHNALYISQRESKNVLQLDATTFAVKQRWSFDTNPNSLLLSDDGNTLYVSLKQAFNKDHSTNGPDSIARIALR